MELSQRCGILMDGEAFCDVLVGLDNDRMIGYVCVCEFEGDEVHDGNIFYAKISLKKGHEKIYCILRKQED